MFDNHSPVGSLGKGHCTCCKIGRVGRYRSPTIENVTFNWFASNFERPMGLSKIHSIEVTSVNTIFCFTHIVSWQKKLDMHAKLQCLPYCTDINILHCRLSVTSASMFHPMTSEILSTKPDQSELIYQEILTPVACRRGNGFAS